MISDELKKIYTSYTDTRRYYDTIQVYHPNFTGFTGSRFFIRDIENKILKLEDDSYVTFESYPFDMVLPEQGSDQQDIGVVFSNVTNELITELELAAQNTDIPIKLFYRVYIDGSDESQITPIELSITNVSVDMMQISATATRANLYDRRFPFGATTKYDRRFTGLFI